MASTDGQQAATHIGIETAWYQGNRYLREGKTVDSGQGEARFEAPERFGHDLVADAADGKLDPVIGGIRKSSRHSSSFDTKNNPVLIGEPGVGKTAIVRA